MNKHRNGEEGNNIPFRVGRFFNIDTDWYFACRDEPDEGPFESKPEAEAALILYMRELNTFNKRFS
ncbi:MAG: DUF6316 family protein [Thiohalomonadales bacterium]